MSVRRGRTTEEDDSHLEVQVLSQDGGLFVHHGTAPHRTAQPPYTSPPLLCGRSLNVYVCVQI